jgi:arylsulfatase A-like enzyme
LTATTGTKAPPNIVYMMFDQAKASAMSFLGNAHLQMPFCERMADIGWVFDNVFAASSICTPSRASVHTGMYPSVHQTTCHQNRAPYNLPQLAEVFQSAGYYTAAAGHYEPERNLGRGWHEQAPMHERGPLFESWMQHIRSGRKDVAWSSGSIDAEASTGNASLLTDRMLRMLTQAQRSEKPFYLHMCYDDPHPPYFVPRPYDTMIDPESLPLPPKGDEHKLPAWQAKARKEAGSAQASDSDARKVLATYYGMIRYIDDEMEKLYTALAQGGHLDNTWIVIGSDHGDYTGEKGLFNKSESLYKCLLHVPLIIVAPHGTSVQATTPARINHLVSSVDLFPTLLGLADISPPINQGIDLLPWVNDGASTAIHDAVFAQVGDYHGYIGTSWPSGMPASGRHKSLTYSARNLTHSYIQDPDNGDEAYDLHADPFELDNLLNDGSAPLCAEHLKLAQHIDAFEQSCTHMREELGVVAGDRGFVKGWE